MHKTTLADAIAKTKEVIKPIQYSSSTLSLYDNAWQGLCHYFSEQQADVFSSKLALEYLSKVRSDFHAGQLKAYKYSLIRKSVMMLIECHETGDVKWRKLPSDQEQILKKQEFIETVDSYAKYLGEKGYSDGTIDIRKTVFRKFLQFVQVNGLEKVTDINQDTVGKFIPFVAQNYQANSMGTVFSSIRSFLTYLFEKKLICKDFTSAVPVDFRRKIRNIPVISEQEEKKLLNASDLRTSIGKRNYAILLLALRLGLRSVDIIQLKLTDIDWRNHTIEVTQQKTGRHMVLPLLAEVGNALMNYLLQGRPTSVEPYVFLRSLCTIQQINKQYFNLQYSQQHDEKSKHQTARR